MLRKNRNKKNGKIDESWLLPYADMLTLLLALFIVLFAMSELDVKKFEQLSYIFQTEFTSGAGVVDEGISIVPEDEPIDTNKKEDEENDGDNSKAKDDVDKRSEEDELAKLRGLEFDKLRSMQKELEKYIALNSLTETIGTKLTGEGLLITVRTDVTFDSGKANVKPQGQEIAKQIAQFLNTDPPQEIVVSGHADDIPMNNHEFASNWELSSMRSEERRVGKE